MADDLERPEERESEPHLPSPTIWPFAFAAGIALALVGLIVSWPIVLIGIALAVVFGFLWAREATREVRAAPAPEPTTPVREEPRYEALEEDVEEHRYSRSGFLEASTLGLGALIGGIVTVPALGFTILPAFRKQGYQDVDLGPLATYAEGDWQVVTFSSRAEGGQYNERTAFVRNNGMANGVPSFTIISNRCAHLGCPVRPQGLSEEPQEVEIEDAHPLRIAKTEPSGFVCPCHGGAYDTEGNRTAGPPVRALDRYEYAIRDGRLVLGEPYSVGQVEGEGAEAQIEAYHIADPGQHVDGLEKFFYPPKFWIK